MSKKRKAKNEKGLRFIPYVLRFSFYDILSLSLLATAVLLFFWPVITRQAWIPRGGGDMASFLFPMYRFAARSLWDGQMPLWNPTLYAGAPFLADNQSGLFYPFNLLLFLIKPDFSYLALQWLVITHFFFAGAAMYACLRGLRPQSQITLFRELEFPKHTVRNKKVRNEHTLSRPAAVLGGLAFMFNGVFITHIGNYNLNAALVWLPLAFLGLHRAVLATAWRQRLAWGIGGGLAVGLGALAGHGQSAFLVAFFLGVYALWQTAFSRSRRRFALPLLALVGLVGIGASALSLFPAFANIRHTLRGGFDFTQAANYSLPWAGLTGLAAPDFFGRGIARFWGTWDRVEFGYVGVLPWFLAMAALVKRPSRLKSFLALAVVFFMLLALGENTPLFTAVFGWWPLMPFQVPARFLFLADFGVAALAAFGLDGLAREVATEDTEDTEGAEDSWFWVGAGLLVGLAGWGLWRQQAVWAEIRPDRAAQMGTAARIFLLLAAGSGGLIWLRMKGWLGTAVFAALAVLLLGLDVIGLGRQVELEPNDPAVGYPLDSPALQFLQNDPGLHRVDIATGAWQASLPQMVGLYGLGGVFNPLQLANYTAYLGAIGPRGGPLHNLLGVKYVVGGKGEPPGDTNFIIPVFDADPDVTIYLNTRALPRAQVIYNARSVPDADAAFAAIHAPDFDPAQAVVALDGRALAQSPGQHTLQILRYDLNQAAFAVTTDKPAYLLLSDIAHPDWQATDNGRPTPIVTADYALRAVFLEPGEHEVVFRYRPSGWRLGLAVSGLTWGLVGWFFGEWLLSGKKKRN